MYTRCICTCSLLWGNSCNVWCVSPNSLHCWLTSYWIWVQVSSSCVYTYSLIWSKCTCTQEYTYKIAPHFDSKCWPIYFVCVFLCAGYENFTDTLKIHMVSLLCILSDCPGLGLMIFQSFSHLISSHLASRYQEALPLLLQNGSKKIETVSLP